jgi:hypothetical protein
VSYFYNRLAYKFGINRLIVIDVNPYTSHLLDTVDSCSSESGPFCHFVNGKNLMSGYQIPSEGVPRSFTNLQTTLRMSVGQSRKMAFDI